MTSHPEALDGKPAFTASAERKSTLWLRLLPLAVIGLAFAAVFAFDLDRYLGFDALRDNRTWLMDFVARNGLLAALAFIGIYAAATALSLPGATILTVAGGFLFGTVVGTGLTVVAATLGATAIFIAARTAFAGLLRGKVSGVLERMRAGFVDNAFSYLLVLRLVPLFPFFLVNLVPAFLGVRLRTYVSATAIGIVPGTFVYTQVGTGLGSVFDRNDSFSLAGILTPEVATALVGLALLSALPVLYRAIKRYRAAR